MRYVDAIFLGKKVRCDCYPWFECTNVDQKLISDQRNFRDKYLQNDEEN